MFVILNLNNNGNYNEKLLERVYPSTMLFLICIIIDKEFAEFDDLLCLNEKENQKHKECVVMKLNSILEQYIDMYPEQTDNMENLVKTLL